MNIIKLSDVHKSYHLGETIVVFFMNTTGTGLVITHRTTIIQKMTFT